MSPVCSRSLTPTKILCMRQLAVVSVRCSKRWMLYAPYWPLSRASPRLRLNPEPGSSNALATCVWFGGSQGQVISSRGGGARWFRRPRQAHHALQRRHCPTLFLITRMAGNHSLSKGRGERGGGGQRSTRG